MKSFRVAVCLLLIVFLGFSTAFGVGKPAIIKNISTDYAVAVYASKDKSSFQIGLFPGRSQGTSYTPGRTRTLFIAYAKSKNLVRSWYTVVSPNQIVTIQDAPQINIEVKGFNSIYVNGVKARPMY
jgi:hypothetical protein